MTSHSRTHTSCISHPQIAVVDLLGIGSGVALSRAVAASPRSLLLLYATLQAAEIASVYRLLRTVQFRVLNFERLYYCVTQFCDSSSNTIPTPVELSNQERILLPTAILSRRIMAYGSLGRAKLSPTELDSLLKLFAKDRFLLVVGENVKCPRRRYRNKPASIQEACHIVLHADASNVDIVKSCLALHVLRQSLQQQSETTMRTSEALPLIANALSQANVLLPVMLRQLTQQGWESPARFMFGRVHMRASWPRPSSS
jgi:hypothetical protein